MNIFDFSAYKPSSWSIRESFEKKETERRIGPQGNALKNLMMGLVAGTGMMLSAQNGAAIGHESQKFLISGSNYGIGSESVIEQGYNQNSRSFFRQGVLHAETGQTIPVDISILKASSDDGDDITIADLIRPLAADAHPHDIRRVLVDLTEDLRMSAYNNPTRLAAYLREAVTRMDSLRSIDVVTYLRSSFPGRNSVRSEWNALLISARRYFTVRDMQPDDRMAGLEDDA